MKSTLALVILFLAHPLVAQSRPMVRQDTRPPVMVQFEPGMDPRCYPGCNQPTQAHPPAPIPREETDAIAAAAWGVMQTKFAFGEITDASDSTVKIRWDSVPTVSQCWSSYWVERAYGYQTGQCATGSSWVSQEPYELAHWRVIVRTDTTVGEVRALVAWETANLALALLGHYELADGPICDDVVRRVLGK